MLAICAVNVFVMISGYFLCTSSQVKISKIIRLYIDVLFFSLLQYCLNCLLKDSTFHLRSFLERFVPLNWYVAVYSGLYLLFPYLNQILQNKSCEQFRFMLLIFFFVLSVWPSGVEFLSKALDFSPNSFSPISNQGSGDGYTLVNFILMYFLGAYCKLHGNQGTSSKQRIFAVLAYLGTTALNIVYAKFFLGRAASYCNPLVIMQKIAIFVFFQNLAIRSKVINLIASCSFGVYLIHAFFFSYCQIEKYVTGNPILIPIHVIVSSVLIYTISALIYWGYQKLCRPLFILLQEKLDFLSYKV